MAKRGIKKRDFEKLDDLTVSRVVSLLEDEKPITKKAACEILNISYNTSRLNRIIEEYKENILYREKRRQANKGKPFADSEIEEIVLSYLKGESIAQISRNLFRPTYMIKSLLNKYNVPQSSKKANYHKPEMIPEEAVSETFKIDEYVWAARYNCIAQVTSEFPYKDRKAYAIWVFGKYNQFGVQPAEELGKLGILKHFKLRDDEFNTTKQNYDYRIH